MESNSSSNFPANYVTLKDLKERWLKRKQDEEEEKLRKLRAEAAAEEEKLRKLRQEEEENRYRKPKEEGRPTSKSKRPSRPARKNASSPGASASHIQRSEKKVEWIEKKMADGAKYCSPPPIAGRRNARKRGSAIVSQSVVKIEEKKAEKQEKMIKSSGKEQTSEIVRREKNIAVAGSNERQRMRKKSGKERTAKMPEKRLESPEKGLTEKKLESSGKEQAAEIIQRVANIGVAGANNVRRGRVSWRGGGIESSMKERALEIIRREKNIAVAGADDRRRMRNEFGKERTAKMQGIRLESPEKGPTEKKQEKKLVSPGKEQTVEIIQRVANIEVAGADDVRRGRVSWRGGGNGNRHLGRRSQFRTSDDGMVWVRKTTDA